ncbi:MAG: sulfatase-like hydrolase/transferase [Pseudomonadota bacterium]|nr:sulfatase-like hydrolase/transferase [Pseudomonadota bacterium]
MMLRLIRQCSLFLLAQSAAWCVGAAESGQPNLVLILADDLGLGDVGVYGSKLVDTPNIDALARSGVRFSQAYVSHPVCSPSRAGLITGRYQQRHGWEFNPARRDLHQGMDLSQQTLADALKKQGYETGLVGKWHLGQAGNFHPLSRGFDEYYGVLGGGSQYVEESGEEVAYALNGEPGPRSDYNAIYRGREKVTETQYLTDAFTREALSFIDRHAESPFFLYLSHIAPHTPLQTTAGYLDRYGHVQDMPSRVYAAMVSALDDSVGAVVQKLRELDQLENTLIAFVSDNGCAGYIGNACSNLGFAGFKRFHQEGGIRVPFILSWPARLKGGQQYTDPIISLDLYSTFTAAAGDMIATEDSVNLLPFLTESAAGRPHDYLYWRSGPTQVIRGPRWKMIRYKKSSFDDGDLDATGRLPPPDGGWDESTPNGELVLLYDLLSDPSERINRADAEAGIVSDLQSRLDQWLLELPPADQAILPAIRSTLTDVDGHTVQLIF